MAKRPTKRQVKKAVKVIKKSPKTALFLAVVLIIVAVAGYYYYTNYIKKDVQALGAMSFHFMMLGNGESGDSIYIKAGDNDILIDGGSRTNSVQAISSYVNQYVTDNTLEYVIVTHADEDHIAAFAGDKTNDSLFDLYKCETIIDFPLTNKTTNVYQRYIQKRDAEVSSDGAVRYSALECYKNLNGAQRVYNLTADGNVKMEILYNYYYEHSTSNENNYSVCVMFYHGSRKFLLTGDLEQSGEQKMVEYYSTNHVGTLSHVELFKAGHHGSNTSSNDFLLDLITPEICVITCAAGADRHNAQYENRFPSQAMINRIAKHTSNVYVTTLNDEAFVGENDYLPMNGNIVVSSTEKDGVTITCSNNDIKLKDTRWFKDSRTWPLNGVA